MTENVCIMGLAAGFHFGDVRPFLLSLKQSGYQGRLYIYVSPTTRDLDAMQALGATVVPFERPPHMGHVPYNAYRYFLYLQTLHQSQERFERILITDVRDVIFQSSPFEYPWEQGLNVTLEDTRMRIHDCPHMRRWVTGHLGRDCFASLHGKQISCSGTTVGDHDSMVEYLQTLTSKLLPFTPGKMMAGYDQGVHNHMLYSGLIRLPHVHDNTGPILTLGYKEHEPERGKDGGILNDAGDRPILVHQYDRMPKLFKEVRERYS